MQQPALTCATDVIEALSSMANEKQRAVFMRFFKTGPGQYGEGDRFLGIMVPQTRLVVKHCGEIPLSEVQHLLNSEWHEVRLCGFLLLVKMMQQEVYLLQRATKRLQKEQHQQAAARCDVIIHFYLRNARRANNWDLVDLSAPYLLGVWLQLPDADGAMPDRSILDHLAVSNNLWEQRIAIVATLGLIRNNLYTDAIRIAERLLSHPHDLIHKAVGWMLREVGKRDKATLEDFLDEHVLQMSRITLRYAIERLPEGERRLWMKRYPRTNTRQSQWP